VKAITEDGTVYDLVVSGGSITLPAGATTTELEVGLHFTSTLQTLRPELATNIGTAQARLKHWNHVTVRVFCTHGALLLNGFPMDYPETITPTGLTPYTGDMAPTDPEGGGPEGALRVNPRAPKPQRGR